MTKTNNLSYILKQIIIQKKKYVHIYKKSEKKYMIMYLAQS